MRTSSSFLIRFLLGFSLAASAKAQSYDPSDDLMFAFGSRCNGKGPISQNAFSDGAAIKNIIHTIRADSKCQGVVGALTDIDNLNVSSVLKDRVADQDVEYLSVQANDFELAIKSESQLAEPDKDYLNALKTELMKIKVNIAKSKKLSNQERTQNRLATIENFQKYSAVLFSRLKQSNECLTNNPSVAASIGAQVLGIGSTLASGVVGSLMLATGNIIDSFVEFFKDRSLGAKVRGVVGARMGKALGCSFEGLAKTYCQARDIQTIIDANVNKTESKGRATWLDGVGAIGQDVASYMAWVTNIDSGSEASTPGRATDKKSGVSQQSDLRNAEIDLKGILNNAKNTVAQSADKNGATKQALNSLAAVMVPKIDFTTGSATPGEGPFSQSFASDVSCGPYIYLYSRGADRTRQGGDPNVACTTYVSTKYPNPPNIQSEVGPLIASIVAEANTAVNVKVSLVNESNPALVVAQADSKFQNRRSAREFMNAAIAYLDNLLSEPNGISKRKNQRDLIEKTRAQLARSLEILARTEDEVPETKPAEPAIAGAKAASKKRQQNPTPEPATPQKQPADPARKVADLAIELVPKGDKFAIPKALSEIINQDIDLKIAQGEIDQNLSVLMELSGNDSLGEMIKFYIGLEAAATQARDARDMTKKNISAIAGTFRDDLQDHFEKLAQESLNDNDAKASLSLLCMQALAIPEAPQIGSTNLNKYCSGTSYQSIYSKSGLKMDYDAESRKSYEERACAVHDFYRKSYLYGLKTNKKSTGQSTPSTQ